MIQFQIIPDLLREPASQRLAARYGLGYEYNDFYAPGVLDDSVELERLLSLAESGGRPDYCTVHGAFLDVSVFSEDPRIADISRLRIRQSLEIAERLGARGVVVHSNFNPFLTDSEYLRVWLERSVDFYGRMLEEYPRLGLWVENMFDAGPAPLQRLAEQLGGYANFGICLDYGHAALSAAPLGEWAERLGPYIRHGHLNDHDGKSDLHLPLGRGCLDWGEFASLRAAFFPEASLLVEVRGEAAQEESLEFLSGMGLL